MLFDFCSYFFLDINDCAEDICQNEGACTDLVNDYECACVAGWDGTNCETSNIFWRGDIGNSCFLKNEKLFQIKSALLKK